MTEADLKQYREIKNEIQDLNKRITETKQGEIVQFGTVKGSSKYFPYVPKNFHVSGMDPVDVSRRERNVSDLLHQREFLRDELLKKQLEIESYIANINDSTTRMIFRMYFIDGLKQQQIAKLVGYDQSRISQIIKNYFKFNKIHKNIC